jgi:hypothetical protein
MAWKVSTIGREESFEKSSIVLLEGGPKKFSICLKKVLIVANRIEES